MIATYPLGNEAFACVNPGSTRTFLFPDIPASIQAPVIAQITVTTLLESSWENKRRAWFTKRRSFKGLAHVNHVIKGAIGTKLIKIIAPDSSCDSPFAVGDPGFVAGSLQADEKGMLECHVIAESFDERQRRQKAK